MVPIERRGSPAQRRSRSRGAKTGLTACGCDVGREGNGRAVRGRKNLRLRAPIPVGGGAPRHKNVAGLWARYARILAEPRAACQRESTRRTYLTQIHISQYFTIMKAVLGVMADVVVAATETQCHHTISRIASGADTTCGLDVEKMSVTAGGIAVAVCKLCRLGSTADEIKSLKGAAMPAWCGRGPQGFDHWWRRRGHGPPPWGRGSAPSGPGAGAWAAGHAGKFLGSG